MNEIEQAKHWLMGDAKEAREWRQDPQNQKEVGNMIDALANVPGGVPRYVVEGFLRDESRALETQETQERVKNQKVNELKELKFAEVSKFGVTKDAFERSWPDMLKEMIDKATLEQEYSRLTNEKRSKAARTF